MQEFDFKYAVNDTYMAVRYYGDEADVVIPDTWYGKPVSVLGGRSFQGPHGDPQYRDPGLGHAHYGLRV